MKKERFMIIKLNLIIIFSFFLLFNCNESPLKNAMDFQPNNVPVITEFTSSYQGADIEPGLHLNLTVKAHDPDNNKIIVSFSSGNGSFTGQADSGGTSSVDFLVGEIKGGEKVSINATVTDTKGASVTRNIVIGQSRPGPSVTQTAPVITKIPGNRCATIRFKSDSNGYYQIQVPDDLNSAVTLDMAKPLFMIEKESEVVINVCGPEYTGNLQVDGIPRLNPVDGTTGRIVIIVRDRMDQEARLEFLINVKDALLTPGNRGTITRESVTPTSHTLRWTEATDNWTAQENLEYRVVISNADNIRSLPEIEVNGTEVMGWTADIDSLNITGLDDSTNYYFNVIVKDEAGKYAVYNSLKSTEIIPPVPGNGGIFSIYNLTQNGATVSIPPANDNKTARENLEYKIVQSLTDNIDTVSDAEVNGAVLMDWTSGISIVTVNGMVPDSVNHVNLLVSDVAGNVSIYSPQSVKLASEIFMFATSTAYNGNMGGIQGINQKCTDEYNLNYNHLGLTKIKAFISRAEPTSIENLNYYEPQLPVDSPFKSYSGVIIANNFSDLLDGTIATSLSLAGVTSQSYWTGSDYDGSASYKYCSNWLGNSDMYTGTVGDPNSIYRTWLNDVYQLCTSENVILCIGW